MNQILRLLYEVMSRQLRETRAGPLLPSELLSHIATQLSRLPQISALCLIRAPVRAQRRGVASVGTGRRKPFASAPPFLLPTAFVRHSLICHASAATGRAERFMHQSTNQSRRRQRRSRSPPCTQGRFDMHLRICTRDCSDGGLRDRPAIDRSAICSAQMLAGGYAPGPQMAVSYRHSSPGDYTFRIVKPYSTRIPSC
jgi:hypothetical protein